MDSAAIYYSELISGETIPVVASNLFLVDQMNRVLYSPTLAWLFVKLPKSMCKNDLSCA